MTTDVRYDLWPAIGGLSLAVPAIALAFRGSGPNFWLRMAVMFGGIGAYALAIDGDTRRLGVRPRDLLDGAASAALLLALAHAGAGLLRRISPAAERGIEAMYEHRKEAPRPVIAALLAGAIAPGEELFWRGLFQSALQRRYGRLQGVGLATACYSCAHLATGNPMLVIAALCAGTFWGLQFNLQRRLAPVIVSHILWDLTVFLVFPLAGAGETDRLPSREGPHSRSAER